MFGCGSLLFFSTKSLISWNEFNNLSSVVFAPEDFGLTFRILNGSLLKIMIIADGDTRGSMNVFYSNKCNVNGTNVKMAMWHMRENGPASMVEIIKDAKKAAWAQNGKWQYT